MNDGGWAVQLPRPQRSSAVLVGTATQVTPSGLHPIPQAAADVRALADALTGPAGHLDPDAVRLRVDPQTATDVLDLFPPAGGGRPDLCLFYYAGHGLLAEGDRLCLALPGSVDEPGRVARTSLPVQDVFAAMSQSAARHKVAVLDCCFAARAFDAPAAADVHLLTATTRTKKARYGEGAEFTGFTGALLELLRDGIPDGPEHLDLGTLHRRLAVTLPTSADRCPVPAQRAVGLSHDLALTRNPAHGTGRTREGLAARARFALRTRRLALQGAVVKPERMEQAVRLFAGIVADGVREFSPTDREVLTYRHAHGSVLGEAGDPPGAAALLDAVVADWESVAAPDDERLTAARASRAHWYHEGAVPPTGQVEPTGSEPSIRPGQSRGAGAPVSPGEPRRPSGR
ncbi:caspase, EACC1-associated type [Streptomyces sp. bgisy100]|uniref:caspase, EACC1-associated type n=1 Tax=Streptomyces sp. bgisy100 TaxID=3413783 RepID=UPI003D743CD6